MALGLDHPGAVGERDFVADHRAGDREQRRTRLDAERSRSPRLRIASSMVAKSAVCTICGSPVAAPACSTTAKRALVPPMSPTRIGNSKASVLPALPVAPSASHAVSSFFLVPPSGASRSALPCLHPAEDPMELVVHGLRGEGREWRRVCAGAIHRIADRLLPSPTLKNHSLRYLPVQSEERDSVTPLTRDASSASRDRPDQGGMAMSFSMSSAGAADRIEHVGVRRIEIGDVRRATPWRR